MFKRVHETLFKHRTKVVLACLGLWIALFLTFIVSRGVNGSLSIIGALEKVLSVTVPAAILAILVGGLVGALSMIKYGEPDYMEEP